MNHHASTLALCLFIGAGFGFWAGQGLSRGTAPASGQNPLTLGIAAVPPAAAPAPTPALPADNATADLLDRAANDLEAAYLESANLEEELRIARKVNARLLLELRMNEAFRPKTPEL